MPDVGLIGCLATPRNTIMVNIFWVILALANLIGLYFASKWYRKEKSAETSIALLAALANVVAIIANIYNEGEQKKELSKLLNDQVNTLTIKVDSLDKKNIKLTRSYDSLSTVITGAGTTSVSGNDNNTASGIGNVAGNQNNVVSGNDRSTIVINPKEEPIVDDNIEVATLIKSKIRIEKGNRIVITATGTINVGPSVGPSGPEGRTGGVLNFPLTDYNIVSEYPHAALLLRLIGDESWINCGKDYSFRAERTGLLEFDINDNRKWDNKGAYKVNVRVFQ